MRDIASTLRADFKDIDFAYDYAETFLDTSIATQIRVLREQRRLTQADLAYRMGSSQTAMCRIENVNYSSWNLTTLKRLARVFHVRLRVSFETLGSLIHEVEQFSREVLERPAYEDDEGLLEDDGPSVTRLPTAMRTQVATNAGRLLSVPTLRMARMGILNSWTSESTFDDASNSHGQAS